MKSLLLYCCYALVSAVQLPAQLLNGDFEMPDVLSETYKTFGTGESIGGWEVYSGAVDLVDHDSFWPTQILDMNALDAGAVRQTLITTPGQKYQLTLTWLPNMTGAPGTTAYMDWNGANYGRFIFLNWGQTPKTESFVFLGTGSDRLSIISQSRGVAGIMVDDFTLVPVDSSTPLSPFLSDSPTVPLAPTPPGVPEPALFATVFGMGLLAFTFARKVGFWHKRAE